MTFVVRVYPNLSDVKVTEVSNYNKVKYMKCHENNYMWIQRELWGFRDQLWRTGTLLKFSESPFQTIKIAHLKAADDTCCGYFTCWAALQRLDMPCSEASQRCLSREGRNYSSSVITQKESGESISQSSRHWTEQRMDWIEVWNPINTKIGERSQRTKQSW